MYLSHLPLYNKATNGIRKYLQNGRISMSKRYDIAIIGTGPAGVSAAITAKVRNKNIIIFGNDSLSDKLIKAQKINNYPGLYAVTGRQLANALREHLQAMDISINNKKVTNIIKTGSYFSILTSDNDMYEASAIIMATGVSFLKSLPGEEELLGRGVSYCATCDAFAYRDKKVAVIGYNKEQEKEAVFLTQTAAKVYYIPMYNTKNEQIFQDGNITPDCNPADRDTSVKNTVNDDNMSEGKSEDKEVVGRVNPRDNLIVIKDIPLSIQEYVDRENIPKNDNNNNVSMLNLVMKGSRLTVDGVFVLRDSVKADKLLSGITLRDNHISVDRNMRTEIEGCFAAGDITGKPYQYIKAAGEGNVAALSAVDYVDNM